MRGGVRTDTLCSMSNRRGIRYWGPALIVIGVIGGIVTTAIARDEVLWWSLSGCALVLLTGVALVGASRLDQS